MTIAKEYTTCLGARDWSWVCNVAHLGVELLYQLSCTHEKDMHYDEAIHRTVCCCETLHATVKKSCGYQHICPSLFWDEVHNVLHSQQLRHQSSCYGLAKAYRICEDLPLQNGYSYYSSTRIR